MARLADIPVPTRDNIANLKCEPVADTAFVEGKPLTERKIAMISTAGFVTRGGGYFRGGDGHYYPISQDVAETDLLISHVSVNFDRTGFRRDMNVMLPRDRIAELAEAGEIGAVSDTHYTFMGATDPKEMREGALHVAADLKAKSVDSAVLIPV